VTITPNPLQLPALLPGPGISLQDSQGIKGPFASFASDGKSPADLPRRFYDY